MIPEEIARHLSALETVKAHRGEASMLVSEAMIHAAADAADVEVCKSHIATLEQQRVAAVVACKPDDVIAIDGELLRARIAVEIATARAAASTKDHGAAVTALRDATAAVETAAHAVLISEMLELAESVTSALDRVLDLGSQLRALASMSALTVRPHASIPSIPREITQVLERLPQPDPLRTPLHLLRAGGVVSNAWADRMAVLTADNFSIDAAA